MRTHVLGAIAIARKWASGAGLSPVRWDADGTGLLRAVSSISCDIDDGISYEATSSKPNYDEMK